MITATVIGLLVVSTIVIHEFFHYIIAKLFGYRPKLLFSSYLSPTITYENKHDHLSNLIISAVGPLGTAVLGAIVPNIQLFSLFKIVCFLHLVCLLPITADGQVILLSILSIIKNRFKDTGE